MNAQVFLGDGPRNFDVPGGRRVDWEFETRSEVHRDRVDVVLRGQLPVGR